MATADEAEVRNTYLTAAADQIKMAIRNHDEAAGLDVLRRVRADGYRVEARTMLLALIIGIHVPPGPYRSDPGE